MRTVFRASLRLYSRRYVSAVIAVTASVAFVVVIGVLVAGARAGIMATDGAPYRAADYVIRASEHEPSRGPACCPETLEVRAAIDLVERLGENASGLGRVALPAQRENGVPIGTGDSRGETTVGPIAASPDLRWQKLVSGRFPLRLGEAVVHVWDANALKLAIGDGVRVGEGATATDLTIVGLVESPTTWTQASMYVTWPQYRHWRGHPTFHVGSVAVRGEVGDLPEGMAANPSQPYVTESLARLNNGTDAFGLMLLLFSSVALFVSVLVVANTFSILFAQRLRDFALLRCLGATRRQVTSSVRREAGAVGMAASATGTVVGLGFGYGLIPLINALAPSTPLSAPELPTLWLMGGFAIGVVVTMCASWVPTRRVVRASPLTALRPVVPVDMHTAAGRVQLSLSVALLITGVMLLGVAMSQGSVALMVAGGALTFAAVLLLGPVLVPRMVTVGGALLGRFGRLAAANAARNPRRTATTAAALLVGVTLTTAVLTGTATWRNGIDLHRDIRLPIDVSLTSVDGPFPAELLEKVRETRGVEQAIVVRGAVTQISGWDTPIPVVAAPHARRVARDGGAFARVGQGTISLDRDAFSSRRKTLNISPGDMIKVRVGEREVELRVILLGGWGRAGVVAPETLAPLTVSRDAHVIWVRAAPNADWLRLVDDLNKLAVPFGAELEDRLQARAVGDRQLDVLTWSALGLLGISVAIALLGIANTLGLSVLERAREHALLRALGLTRRQLQGILAAEALLLSIAATLLGNAIGIGFAWVGYETFVKPALTEATMQIPWRALCIVFLVSALAGLLSSVLPARQAAKVPPAAGLALD